MTDGIVQIAFLTGRSDPASAALSPAQAAFLTALAGPGRRLRTENFPYRAGGPAYRPVPLWLASLRNGRDYLASRRPGFRHRHRAAVLALLEAAPRTVFLAGSCGLELFNNLALPAAHLGRVALFAYGPVARRRPACRHRLIQGRDDLLSRLSGPRADHIVDAHHLNYLASADVLRLCREYLAELDRTWPPTT